jgi:hypothetical protein
MENTLTTAALDALRHGLSPIPCNANKVPALASWKPYMKAPMPEEELPDRFAGAWGLGLVCGKVAGGLEVLDVDLKYDPTGLLWAHLRETIQDHLPGLLDRLVITETMSGGRHLLFRCEVNEGNLKLASRPATPQESEKGEKVKVLLETRGEGGYIVAPPSPDYTFLQGDLATIPAITQEERETLLAIARSFDEMPIAEELRPSAPSPGRTPTSATGAYLETPLAHYKREGDVLGLLQRHGWGVVKRQGDRIQLRRPGKEGRNETSGNWHQGHRRLQVFSTSTEFDPARTYSASDVFVRLEAGGDARRAYELLKAEGYGTSADRPTADYFDRIQDHPLERGGEEAHTRLRILGDEEIDEELRTMPARKSTGWRSWDRYVKLRPAALTLVGATPGAGKSLVLLNMALNMAETYPDEVFVFVSAEMPASEVRLRLQTAASYRGGYRRSRILWERRGCYLTTKEGRAWMAFTDGPTKVLDGRPRCAADGEYMESDAELLEAIQRQALQRGTTAAEVIEELVAQHYTAPTTTDTPRLFVEGLRQVEELRKAGRLVVVDAPDETVPTSELDALLETVHQQAQEKGLTIGAVFVDYAGLVESAKGEREDYRIRTIYACNDLKRIAKQYAVPVVVAAQLNTRESDTKLAGKAKSKPEDPTSHWQALGKPLVPEGDKFAETSQFYRAADLVLYLCNPMQEAGGSDEELVRPYLTHGELPLFVKVAKMRGGAPKKWLELGYVQHAQALHETFEPPAADLVKIYTEAEAAERAARAKKKKEQDPEVQHTPKGRKEKDTPVPEHLNTPLF